MFEIVINPAGAGGAAMKAWKKAEPVFQKSGAEYHVTYSTRSHDLDAIAHDLTMHDREIDLVILGGDGSMNKALNGLMNLAHVRIGFIPCGSGNDLAKALGIPKDPIACARKILEGKVVRTLDFGEVTYLNACHFRNGRGDTEEPFTRRFHISSGIGFDAEICANVNVSKSKKFFNKIHLGKLIYLFVAMRIIFASHKIDALIQFDHQKPVKKKMLAAVAMNTAYEGGGFKFCPAADPQDGILDVCVWGDVSKADFFKMFPYAYSGAHLKFDSIDADQVSLVDIQADQPCWIHTDGEVECMSTHVQMQLAKEKLQYLN
jgi:YegS/Rv2252/BmrU family lipid kinase